MHARVFFSCVCALQYTWVVYMWLFSSVFHLLVQLQFTCVLHTCVTACALQFTWVSCIHVTVHLCVSYTCAVAIYLCAAYMCQLTSSGPFGLHIQVICVVGSDTCVVYMWNSHYLRITCGFSLTCGILVSYWRIIFDCVCSVFSVYCRLGSWSNVVISSKHM